MDDIGQQGGIDLAGDVIALQSGASGAFHAQMIESGIVAQGSAGISSKCRAPGLPIGDRHLNIVAAMQDQQWLEARSGSTESTLCQ